MEFNDGGLEGWAEGWSTGTESDETGSSYNSDDDDDSSSSSAQRNEAVRVGGESFLLPQGLCDNADIFKEFLSADTWNGLSEENRQHLMNFLPEFPENDSEEKETTLNMLFSRECFRFGASPLTEFHKHLQAGFYRPDISKMRTLLKKAEEKLYSRSEKNRLWKLLQSVLVSRCKMVDAVVSGEKPKPIPSSTKNAKSSVQFKQNVKSRYFQELTLIREEVGESSQSSEDENYPEGPALGMSKKFKRMMSIQDLLEDENYEPVLGTLCSGPSPWDPNSKNPQGNPYAVPEQAYSQVLAQHIKRRNRHEFHPDLQVDGITLADVAMRCKFLKRIPNSKPAVPKKVKGKVMPFPNQNSTQVLREDSLDDPLSVEEIKKEIMDDIEVRVDVEGVDDLPQLPIAPGRNPMSSLFPMSPKGSRFGLLSKKVKQEFPGDHPASTAPSLVRKCPLAPEPKRIRSDSVDSRKIKPLDQSEPLLKRRHSETSDVASFVPSKKVKVEHIELPPLMIKVEPPSTPPLSPMAVVPQEPPPQPPLPPPPPKPVPVQKITPTPPPPLPSPVAPPALSTTPVVTAVAHSSLSSTVPAPSVYSMASMKNLSSRLMTPATLSDLDGIDMMDLPVDFDVSSPLESFEVESSLKTRPELMQETHACFFSLIREILTSTPDHRIEMKELESRVKAWANSPIGPINPWYTPQLESQLSSAVLFLAGDMTEALPEDYVPYMEWKSSVGAYQWIGAGRDSDHRLVSLCAVWLERGTDRTYSGGSGGNGGGSSNGLGGGTFPHTLNLMPEHPAKGPAIQPSSPRTRESYRIQEKLRYEQPNKPFTYNINGVERTVGPIRLASSNHLNKARGHLLLSEERPKHVTILELVRDAVARLPDGQGTRSDIVTLLKDSQYLLESPPESTLSSVVSGVLDRLHTEKDPCVVYDPKRKMWVYLHKGRSPEEFVRRLQAIEAEIKIKNKVVRKPPRPKKDVPQKVEVMLEGVATSVPESTIVLSEAQQVTKAATEAVATIVDKLTTPVIVQAKPKVMPKPVTSIATTSVVPKKVVSESVKTIPGKSRVKVVRAPGDIAPVTTILSPSTSQTSVVVSTSSPSLTTTVQQQAVLVGSPQHATQHIRIQGVQSPSSAVVKSPSTAIVKNPLMTAIVKSPSTAAVKRPPNIEVQKSAVGVPVVTSRAVVHDGTVSGTTALLRTSAGQNVLKKVTTQGMTISADQIISKQSGKSFVKVIASSQLGPHGVRTVQRVPQMSQQQVAQLKQQLLGEQSAVTTSTAAVVGAQKIVTSTGKKTVPGQQQLIVMKQSSSGEPGSGTIGQQQMIVINQQPIVVDSQQMTLKQHKQLQQLLNKTVQDTQSQGKQSSSPTPIQKILPQQQQIQQIFVAKQASGGDQQKKIQQQMIVMKQQAATSTDGSVKQPVQQMFLVKQSGVDGESTTTQLSSQQLQQMLVLKQQQTQGQGSGHQQQIIMVKQQDQKPVQVIAQNTKGQPQQLTLAQLQQIQQSQRASGGSPIITQSRVLAHGRVSGAATSVSGTSILKPHITSGGNPVVAKVVTSSAPILTVENVVPQKHQTSQAAVRMPATSRPTGLASQFVTVSLPQSRVVQGNVTTAQVVASSSTVPTSGVVAVTTVSDGVGGSTAATKTHSVRIPGLNFANIAGKQVLLASKPATSTATVQGQNVILGSTAGQTLLVGGGQQGTVTVLQQGSQQILLPPGALKTLQGLKVIPLAQAKPSPGQTGRQQVYARIINPSTVRPVIAANVVQQVPTSQQQQQAPPQDISTTPASNPQSKE